MWKLFASQQYGIAVRTTATRLIGSFTEQLPDYFGRVSYIAYDSHLMPVTEFPPVFFKRSAFKHESEVRAVVAPEHRVEKAEVDTGSPGLDYPNDPERLIEGGCGQPVQPRLAARRRAVGPSKSTKSNAAVERSVLERRPPGEGASATARNLKAYFAFREGKRPLRVWTTSRAYALEAACEHWQHKSRRGANRRLDRRRNATPDTMIDRTNTNES